MPNPTDKDELREEITKLFFRTRHSNTVLQQDVLIGCEICEKPLEEERFWDTEKEQILAEQEPILNAILDLFDHYADQRVKEALMQLKQYNGAYIGIDGRRVDDMVSHTVTDEMLATLKEGK